MHSNSDSSKLVISRFHWHVATIWTQTNQEENKPKVNFVKGVHTPIVETTNDDFRYFEFEPNLPLKERIEMVNLYLPIFIKCRDSVKFDGEKINYEGLIVEGQVPDGYIFNLGDIKASFIIGDFPKIEQFPEVLQEKLKK